MGKEPFHHERSRPRQRNVMPATSNGDEAGELQSIGQNSLLYLIFTRSVDLQVPDQLAGDMSGPKAEQQFDDLSARECE